MNTTHIAGSIILIIVLIIALRYLYAWLNGAGDEHNVRVYTPSGNGLVANSRKAISFNTPGVGGIAPPPLYGGGEFSVSTWVYINNWSYANTYNKVFLTLSGSDGSGFNTMVMYLGQSTNKLGIRVSTDNGLSLSPTVMGTINQMNGSSSYTDASADFKMCDIDSIDLQRWVNITTVVSGKTIDVYINGKLSRSCVLPGIYKVEPGNNATITLGGVSPTGVPGSTPATGFGGYIGQTYMANYAYSPDYIYAQYLNGPFPVSLVGQLLGMFGINTTVAMPNLPVIPSVHVIPPSFSITY